MAGAIQPFQIEKVYWGNVEDRGKISQILQQGGVVAGTSDTVPGLLAEATEDGFRALNRIKGRSGRPYLILIDSQDKLPNFVAMPLSVQVLQLIEHCWPGPLTLVLKARSDLPDCCKASDGTVALRVPDHDGLLALLHDFPGLFSTSANKATMSVPHTPEEIDAEILQEVDCLVLDENKRPEVDQLEASTILDCSADKFYVIREGAYRIEDLKKIVGTDLF